MSSLIETLAAPPQKRLPGKSVMDVWVSTLPEHEKDAVLVAATNPDWGHVVLLEELVRAGAPKMSDTAFRAWRIKVGLGE